MKYIETRLPVCLVKENPAKFWKKHSMLKNYRKSYGTHKIETILKKSKKGGRVQYSFKWLGYPESFNSWIFKQDLQKHAIPTWSVSLGWLVERRLHVRRSYFGSGPHPVHGYHSQYLQVDVESENSTLWTALLSSFLGYLLPSPTIKTKHVLPDSC